MLSQYSKKAFERGLEMLMKMMITMTTMTMMGAHMTPALKEFHCLVASGYLSVTVLLSKSPF